MEKKQAPKWGVTNEELERLKPFGLTDKHAVSDFIDETGVGTNILARVLETAVAKGYITPVGAKQSRTKIVVGLGGDMANQFNEEGDEEYEDAWTNESAVYNSDGSLYRKWVINYESKSK